MLTVPLDLLQPFFLRYRHDDLHVMAFFEGHAEYEAVEAMIRRKADGGYSIRAIITRHNQSQIDHINDEALLAEMRGAQRETCHRPIDLQLGAGEGGRRARLAFTSHAGESVVLDLTTAGEPDAARGGLTDPGGHSATSSLPLMWRGASALAGPLTTVSIDNVAYLVPEKVRRGPFVALEGYYSEPHIMGVIRAGTVTTRWLKRPERLDIGSEWVCEVDGREVVRRVTRRRSDGGLRIETPDSGETIIAVAGRDGLEIAEIQALGDTNAGSGLTLSFETRGRFALSMEGAPNLVTGAVEIANLAQTSRISLRPATPDWATGRVVHVDCAREDGAVTCITTIGD